MPQTALLWHWPSTGGTPVLSPFGVVCRILLRCLIAGGVNGTSFRAAERARAAPFKSSRCCFGNQGKVLVQAHVCVQHDEAWSSRRTGAAIHMQTTVQQQVAESASHRGRCVLVGEDGSSATASMKAPLSNNNVAAAKKTLYWGGSTSAAWSVA